MTEYVRPLEAAGILAAQLGIPKADAIALLIDSGIPTIRTGEPVRAYMDRADVLAYASHLTRESTR